MQKFWIQIKHISDFWRNSFINVVSLWKSLGLQIIYTNLLHYNYIVFHSFPSHSWLKSLIKCPHVDNVFNQPRWRCLNLLFFTKWMQIGLAGVFQKLHFPPFPESVVHERESNFPLLWLGMVWIRIFLQQHGMFRLLKIWQLGVSTCFNTKDFSNQPTPQVLLNLSRSSRRFSSESPSNISEKGGGCEDLQHPQ